MVSYFHTGFFNFLFLQSFLLWQDLYLSIHLLVLTFVRVMAKQPLIPYFIAALSVSNKSETLSKVWAGTESDRKEKHTSKFP